jgi:peptide/nickel transport system substrate-binding protein
VPRVEPANWAAGGKVARVDRVEWLYIPDPAMALAAFTRGEADWWENPPPDFYPTLAADPKVKLVQTNPLGQGGLIRFNHLLPPGALHVERVEEVRGEGDESIADLG